MNKSNLFSKMTPAQKKRLGELVMKGIMDQPDPGAPMRLEQIATQLKAQPGKAHARPSTVKEILDGIEHLQASIEAEREDRTMQMVEQTFDREELFRFAYVPFVIAELVWDYADTVILMAQRLGNPATRKLSRVVRTARKDYEQLRHKFISPGQREREIENGYVFEDAIRRITDQMLANVRIDISKEYPALNEDSRNLLLAVHQCNIMSKALLRYLGKQSGKVAGRVGHSIGRILPPSYYVMDRLIPEFVGDKPASESFRNLMKQYIETISVQMELVDLNER